MKILHILATPRAEGVPNLVLDWLGVNGHEQEVFVLHHAPADLTADFRRRSHWYSESDLFDRRGPRKFLRTIREIRRVCRERQPDLVIGWFTGFAPWIALGVRLGRGGKTKLLVHCGNPPSSGARSDWMARLQMWPTWLLGGRCACCSDYVRDLYRGIRGLPGACFATVYNCVRVGTVRAVACTARAARDEISPTGIMVATMEAHKDHATLLRALPTVLAARPDFQLLLVGDGSLRPSLESLARELGIAEAVRFLGARRNVPTWLGRADLFIFSTTLQEGFGSVLLEAMAAGLPIIATDCPACREVLLEGRFGSLVPPKDAAALAQGILDHLVSINDWQPTDAIEYTAGFTPERMLNEYVALAHAHASGCR